MHPKTACDRIRFAEFEVDLASGELFREGRKVPLQEQPFQVLHILLERPGQLVTREELRNQLWPADTFVDFDHGLNKAVAKLREALAQAGGKSPLIETLPRRGYRFIGPVEWMNGNHSAAAESLPAVSQSGSHQRTDARWMFRFPGSRDFVVACSDRSTTRTWVYGLYLSPVGRPPLHDDSSVNQSSGSRN